MHPNTLLLFEKYALPYFPPGSLVLEVGPDHPPSTLRRCINDASIRWDTVDIYSAPDLTYTATNEYSFPIADETYDAIVAVNVLEHVRKPWVWVKELTRVCNAADT